MAGQVRVDEITDELGTGSPSFPNGVAASELTGDIAADRMKDGFNASGAAPVYACRAWVNFDGTTTTPTIRASGNVSSVTRNGTGNYTVNFTTAMPDANYATVSNSKQSTAASVGASNAVLPSSSSVSQAGSVRVHTVYLTGSVDGVVVQVSVFR